MLSRVKCVAFKGLEVIEVVVEVNSSTRGLPSFDIVGLPNKSVEESKHRIRSAFTLSGFEFPSNRLTVNLAPADIHKNGSFYDLPIAVGIFCAKNNITIDKNWFFFGELSLSGEVKDTRGSYLAVDYVSTGAGTIFVSWGAKVGNGSIGKVYFVKSLKELFGYLMGKNKLGVSRQECNELSSATRTFEVDIADVIGQQTAKRALEIAAAGGHNLMLVGPPGTGKSMLAKSIVSILPGLSSAESREIRKINSYVGEDLSLVVSRPFREPHHTISYSGMIGGGNEPAPGEITLAHNGVLFMDEFCEFSRNVLEAMRQPLQTGRITLTRNNSSFVFPAKFTLIAASNPCPCGYLGHQTRTCECSEQKLSNYGKKLSGPVADRIDMYVNVYSENITQSPKNTGKSETEKIRERVFGARERQVGRLARFGKFSNAFMSNKEIELTCAVTSEAKSFLNDAYKKFGFSLRAYFKLLKMAATIADLEGAGEIKVEHVAEALQYRQR